MPSAYGSALYEFTTLVCGRCKFEDRQALNQMLDRLSQERGFSLVIAGGARGADALAEEWAKASGVPCTVYPADWEGLGPKAGPIRNQHMLDEGLPDLVVAFPGAAALAAEEPRAPLRGEAP